MMPTVPSQNLIVSGHLQENDLVYVKLPQGKYLLGQSFFTIPYNGGEQIIDLAEINNLQRVVEESKLVAYKNIDDGTEITVGDYIKGKQEVDTRVYNEEHDEDVWKSVKERHAYELYTAIWQPVRVQVTSSYKVEIVIEGAAPIADHPFIIPIRKLSGDLTNTLYTYSRNAHVISLVEHYLKKNGYRLLDQEPPSMSNPKDMDRTYWIKGELQFSKIFPSRELGSKYITIEIPGLKQYEKITGRMTGTFAELEAYFKLTDEDVRATMGAYFNKATAIDALDKETVGQVLGSLEGLAKTLREVESMKKTCSEYSSAIKQLNDIIKTFRKAVCNEL